MLTLPLFLFSLSNAVASPPDATPDSHDARPDVDDDSERLMNHFSEMATRLELNDTQRTSIEELYYASKMARIDLKAASERTQLELKRITLSTTAYDEKAALKAFEAASAAEVALKRNNFTLMSGVRKQLTPKQWAGLQEMRMESRDERQERRGSRRERTTLPAPLGN